MMQETDWEKVGMWILAAAFFVLIAGFAALLWSYLWQVWSGELALTP